MAQSLMRIVTSDVTEALINATEEAGELDDVCILYIRKDGGTGFFHAGTTTCAELNWMADRLKAYLLHAESED